MTISEIYKNMARFTESEGKQYIEELKRHGEVICMYEDKYRRYKFANGYIAFVQEGNKGEWIAEEDGHFCLAI